MWKEKSTGEGSDGEVAISLSSYSPFTFSGKEKPEVKMEIHTVFQKLGEGRQSSQGRFLSQYLFVRNKETAKYNCWICYYKFSKNKSSALFFTPINLKEKENYKWKNGLFYENR